MTWSIKVEKLSKQYRIGSTITPAVNSIQQVFDERISLLVNKFTRGDQNKKINPSKRMNENGEKLIITPQQQEGCPRGFFWALRDVSFEIQEGDRVGIVGRNGSGKSTLLKILSRITTPTYGKFSYRGRLVSLLEVGTGFHPDLTGRENIFLNARINGMKTSAIQKVFDEIIQFSELGPQIDTPIKRYSSGMYMRLAFAVAAHLESEILIVDEVLAVGDGAFQKKCMDKMLQISEGGRTLLFVSHDMNSISSLCTKALELSHGMVVDKPAQNSLKNSNEFSIVPDIIGSSGLRSVQEAISDYVLEGTDCVERVLHEYDEGHKMAGLDIRLLRVAVVNDFNQVAGQFDVSDNIGIVIDFENNEENVRLNAHIYLSTLTGQRLLVSMDNLCIPSELFERPKGVYTEKCTINSDVLNEGVYRVEVVICTNPTSENFIAIPDVVAFTVTDRLGKGLVRGDWIRKWPDYPIRIRFDWSVKKEDYTLNA